MSTIKYRGPIVLAIMDGIGLRQDTTGNAVAQGRMDFFQQITKKYLNLPLLASGEAVGILPGTMGNSEVGHSTIGSGQIIPRGAAQVEHYFKTGEIWQTASWHKLIEHSQHTTLHLVGILSDGGVHSHIDHLFKILDQASHQGITRLRLHLIFDGRDVLPQSADKYLSQLEQHLISLNQPDYQIASGGGRMVFIADRYQAEWPIVKAGWDAMVHGQAPHYFSSASEAISYFRAKDPKLQDQYLPPFVIKNQDQPVGRVASGDTILCFNFRADRAVELAMAFDQPDFSYFDRGLVPEDLLFVGLTEYDSDQKIPRHTLIPRPEIKDTLNQFLGEHQISQFAISETVKFGHVTYFFNGESYQPAPLEVHQEIPSDTKPFDTRPWMKAAEITDVVLDRLADFQFVRLNYPNGDMVGHLGGLQSTIQAVEAVDLQLQRLAERVDQLGGILIITADHGNAEEVRDLNNQPITSHTTNPVPCIFYDNTENAKLYQLGPVANPGLSNLAATIAFLLGQNQTPSTWQPSLLELKDQFSNLESVFPGLDLS